MTSASRDNLSRTDRSTPVAELFSICATCGVEYAHPLPDVCAICHDDRQ